MTNYQDLNRAIQEINLDNTHRDIVDVESHGPTLNIPKYGPARYVPILPQTVMAISKNIELNERYFDAKNILEWTVYADNANPVHGKVCFTDLPRNHILVD